MQLRYIQRDLVVESFAVAYVGAVIDNPKHVGRMVAGAGCRR